MILRLFFILNILLVSTPLCGMLKRRVDAINLVDVYIDETIWQCNYGAFLKWVARVDFCDQEKYIQNNRQRFLDAVEERRTRLDHKQSLYVGLLTQFQKCSEAKEFEHKQQQLNHIEAFVWRNKIGWVSRSGWMDPYKSDSSSCSSEWDLSDSSDASDTE